MRPAPNLLACVLGFTPATPPDDPLLRPRLRAALATLRPREQEVLVLRYGLFDGAPHTGLEVAAQLKLTRSRIYQIEAKAIRKLRHPSRLRPLLKDL